MREHIEHLLAALGAVGLALFISYFNTGAVVHVAPLNSSHSGLTPLPPDPSVPSFEISTATLESIFPSHIATSSTPSVVPTTTPAHPKPRATNVPPKATPSVATKPVATPPPPVVQATSTAPAPATTSNADELATLKKSIVNILCIAHDGSLHSISGSGVFIDSRGLILTVAHVAQLELLEEYRGMDKVSCTVRMGSPARSVYTARPVYVSKSWLKKNSTVLISSQPTGTGENDFAVLAVTGSVTGASLPGAFPAVPIASGNTRVGTTVGIGSYGSQNLSTTQVKNALYPTLVMSTVTNRYTFTTNTVDVLAIGGTAASQEGSSGGAVINENGELLGIITTSDITGAEAKREMRAITPGHIRRSFTDDTGKDFSSYFGDTSILTLVNSYAPEAQTLGEFLAKAIGLTR